MRLVRVRQTWTGADIPILLITTPITPVRRYCHTNYKSTVPGQGLQQKNTKNALHCTAQNDPTHHPDNIKYKKQNSEKKTFVTTK